MTKDEIDGERIFVINDFLNPAECEQFIAVSELQQYEEATITTTAGFVMNKEVRDNARLIVDDLALAAQLWERAKPWLPATLYALRGRTLTAAEFAAANQPAMVSEWEATGLNERFRYYRYDAGQKFAPHYDGYFARNDGERSRLTFMIYLNEGFQGGETVFFASREQTDRLHIVPARGMALVFVHEQLHEGAPIVHGRKYVLRTDVIYRRRD